MTWHFLTFWIESGDSPFIFVVVLYLNLLIFYYILINKCLFSDETPLQYCCFYIFFDIFHSQVI